MKNLTYLTTIKGNKVVITKEYRTRTQYDYFLKIFIGNSEFESINFYQEHHLTKRSAISEALRSLSCKPKMIKIV
jgi:hypothetical protein